MNILEKIIVRIRSILLQLYYCIFHQKTVPVFKKNIIRGKFIITTENSKCIIGTRLMTMGPMYIKVLENAIVQIGTNCFFNHNCSITCCNHILIGNGCNFANNVVIVDHDHIVSKKGVERDLVSAPIVIDDRVWIGANVTILKGVHIGEGAVIAANSVVCSDVAPHSMVAGVPAKFIKNIK